MDPAIQRLHEQAIAAVNSGRYSEAEQLCSKVLAKDERFADAWFIKSMTFAGRVNVRQALDDLIKALRLAPNNAEYLAQFSKLCLLINQEKKALAAAQRAIAQKPTQALTLDTLGVVLTKLGEYESAQSVLHLAVKQQAENPQFHFNLAAAEQFLGNEQLAEYHYLEAIRLKPNFTRAYWAFSELKKNQSTPEHIEKLESLLNKKGISDDDELYLSHALSREKEKQGDYKEAFELLERGKFRYRAKLNYSWVVDERLFKAIEAEFPLNGSPDVPPEQGKEAIFVLGMPRSGTTVVERILSSHSQVESLGELQNFALAVKRESATTSNIVLDPAVVKQTQSMDMAKLGQMYLSSLVNRDVSKPYFVDKTPLNFLTLGYIAESLPSAKIVLVRRNPMDTCLSNFRQLFAMSFSYYNYHYDLVDTGQYFRLFDDLIKLWMKNYGDRIHIVDYETLTAQPKEQVTRLLDYCGLEQQAACVAFHENTSAVATASSMQVREPMYRSSVQRWKKYEDQLAPLKEIFNQAGIEY